MFAWYWRCVKQPRSGFVYQMCYVLHYRLVNVPPPPKPEPTITVQDPPPPQHPLSSASPPPQHPPSSESPPSSASPPLQRVRHPRPVTVLHKKEESQCEWCGKLTTSSFRIHIQVNNIWDVEEKEDEPRAPICNLECLLEYQKWCRSLLPGLEYRSKYPGDPADLVRLTFSGIFIKYEGEALHHNWRIQMCLLKYKKRTGMVVMPYNKEHVKWDDEPCTPCFFFSLKQLRGMFPCPTPAH